MTESFADLFAESQSQIQLNIPKGKIIPAKVMRIRGDEVILDAGLKSESIVSIKEFYREDGTLEIAVGDTVEVMLDSVEDGSGETLLSREKARRLKTWEDLEKAMETQENVSGLVSGRVKGGFTVDIKDVKAFLPGSLVDVRPVRDASYIEGKVLDFKVIKLDKKRNNVVLSRRHVLETEYNAEREDLLNRLEEGQIVTGVVKNLTEYGAFLDLGGIDGLLHITDMAWRRVRHPSEVVAIGDSIEVKIMKFDREKCRVSLGLKQLGADPWETLAESYPKGSRHFGKVTNLTDYGCFVEIAPGVEGLVHVSEMDWVSKTVNPAKVVATGDEVEVMILDVDVERRRISLGMKQCQDNPWALFSQKYQRGDIVHGQIRSLTDFGIFVELEGGVDGLVHLNDIAWDRPGEEAIRDYKKGDAVEAMVMAIDVDRERISLSIKEISEDPFAPFLADNVVGSVVQAMVENVEPRLANLTVQGIPAQMRARDASRDPVEDLTRLLHVGQELTVKIIEVDARDRSLKVSARAYLEDEERAIVEDYQQQGAEATTNLGAVFKQQVTRDLAESSSASDEVQAEPAADSAATDIEPMAVSTPEVSADTASGITHANATDLSEPSSKGEKTE
jgi:small subunit ribosomal protein S1